MPVSIEKLPGIALLPFTDAKPFLKTELKERFGLDELNVTEYQDLMYFPEGLCQPATASNPNAFSLPLSPDAPSANPYWAKTVLFEPFLLHFDSISEAAGALKGIQRNWAPYQYQLFRRAALIQDKLPYINLKPRKFPFTIPDSPMGCYTLIDSNTILASASTSTPLPCGTITWIEDHENPPSRAYLKIQESLVMSNLFFKTPIPSTGMRVFEAGACPGGWTWVFVNQGAQVYAVDRAELAPQLMTDPLVTFQAHDAFTLKPEEIGPCDFVVSDVICYPERLLEWVKVWLDSGLTKNMICTIKMQGGTNWETVQAFADIPGSRVIHLNYNKHEFTWIHSQE